MEDQTNTLDGEDIVIDITCNSTYAQVLSKNTSNNNCTTETENVNGNEAKVVSSDVNESPAKDADSSLAELSNATDSFEDAEDSQLLDSSSTVKSSDMIHNTEESSSLVTADENNSKPVDQSGSQWSGEYLEISCFTREKRNRLVCQNAYFILTSMAKKL